MKKLLLLACAALLSAGLFSFSVHTASAQSPEADVPVASEPEAQAPSYDALKADLLKQRDEMVAALTTPEAVQLKAQIKQAYGALLNGEIAYAEAKSKGASKEDLAKIADAYLADVKRGMTAAEALVSKIAAPTSNLLFISMSMAMTDAERLAKDEQYLQDQFKPVEAALEVSTTFEAMVKPVVDQTQAGVQARLQKGLGIDQDSLDEELSKAVHAHLDSIKMGE